jgi:ribosome-binding protein aMBF1 (putative translation factor)
MDDWQGVLIEARKHFAVSRARLAEMAAVSAETLRGCEIGRGRPKHETLESIIGVLRLERVRADRIGESAGFAAVRSLFGDEPRRGAALGRLVRP